MTPGLVLALARLKNVPIHSDTVMEVPFTQESGRARTRMKFQTPPPFQEKKV